MGSRGSKHVLMGARYWWIGVEFGLSITIENKMQKKTRKKIKEQYMVKRLRLSQQTVFLPGNGARNAC
jgi:hypothetical protein